MADVVSGLVAEEVGRRPDLELKGARWSKMAETLETKREGGARTSAMPMKRKKERAATRVVLETASLTG